MRKLACCLARLVVGAIAIASLTSCAGAKASETAVEVAGHRISKNTVDHWIPIEAIISREPIPQQPIPPGEVPDPPHYTACVAYMRATTPQAASAQTPSTTKRFKSECQKRYEDIRRHMIDILITYQWVSAEAAAQGVTVSDSEVQQQWAQFKHDQYPTEAIFQRFLKYTGATLSDELFLERFDLLASKLNQKIVLMDGIPGATRFTRDFPKRWAAKTDCRLQYVVPDCKQYKGPLPPAAAI